MRSIFALVALASLAATVLFGSVLAWRTSDSARGAAVVGKNGFAITYEPNCTGPLPVPVDDVGDDVELAAAPAPIPCATLIGPNGTTTVVGKGIGKNNGDFDLVVVGGDVEVRRLLPGSANSCRPDHFTGHIRLLDANRRIPPGGEGGTFAAYLGVNADGPPECQGQVVVYRVTIVAENPVPSPVENLPREE